MSAQVQNYSADIPEGLHEADSILTRYGRWAANTGRGARTCGSAEGRYRASGIEALESRRTPADVPLTPAQRVAAQRALVRVPDCERAVLSVLYVPRRQSIGHQLRLLGVPARLSAERHLLGLRIWWNLYQMLARA